MNTGKSDEAECVEFRGARTAVRIAAEAMLKDVADNGAKIKAIKTTVGILHKDNFRINYFADGNAIVVPSSV
ncbi:MAG: hypothetical protein LBI39_01790 [Puniceicoccales bacterium]|nr:hypothetical protein [Puniceicoccales bacterium]